MMKRLQSVVLFLVLAGCLWRSGRAAAAAGDGDTAPSADIEDRLALRRESLADWSQQIARSRKQADLLAGREKSLKAEIAAKRKQLAARQSHSENIESSGTVLARRRDTTSATLAAQRQAEAALAGQVAGLGTALSGQSLAQRVHWQQATEPRSALAFYLTAIEMQTAEHAQAQMADAIRRNEQGLQETVQAWGNAEREKREAVGETKSLAAEIGRLEKEVAEVGRNRESYLRRVTVLTKLRGQVEKETADLEAQRRDRAKSAMNPKSDVRNPQSDEPARRVPLPAGLREGTGSDLMVAEGTEVHAIEAGEVLFADRFKGYGNLVILEHAKGMLSLYGFLSEIRVTAGTVVSQGQVIGRSGFIEDRDRAGLRFEMRLMRESRDVAIDPRSWLPDGADLLRRLLRGTD